MVRSSLVTAAWTVPVLLLSSARLVASTCDLSCDHPDAVCVQGSATFDSHPVPQDALFSFHASQDVNGMHCSCPTGWTGVTCDTVFETCDYTSSSSSSSSSSATGSHKCYHGGKCVPGLLDDFGNDQLFCNCENAIDSQGNQYAGKYCEHKATTFCDSDDDSHFCLNEGDCNPNYPLSGEPCLCSGGYQGDHCQFKAGTVPDCDSDCENGHCVLGEMTVAEKADSYQFWDDDQADPSMYCKCNTGFDGTLCEIEKVECGDDAHCFHGGTCIDRTVDGKKLHHCDCATATDENGDSYAGRVCQYRANEYCTKDVGFNGQLFCVNGGDCNINNPYDGCLCEKGFAGFACEFVMGDFDAKDGASSTATGGGIFAEVGRPIVDFDDDTEPCELNCKEGTCRNGKKELGFLAEVASTAAHLNKTYNEDFQHCVCPNGFVGLLCEHKIHLCDEGEHLCLHGGLCSKDGDDSSCDCRTTDSDLAPVFAGQHCEHPATEVCTIDDSGPAKPLSFCVNFGACLKQVTSDEPHPGCLCENGWDGPHCEVKISRDAVSSTSNGDSGGNDSYSSTGSVFFISVLAIAVAVLSLVLATVLVRNRKRRNDSMSNGLHWGGSSYRDSPKVNLSPRRDSNFVTKEPQVDYPPSAHSSSRDPMATHLAPSQPAQSQPQVYIGPPRDEDGHELHSVEIV